MRNPFTVGRRRFVAATMAEADDRATARAEQIAEGWIADANARAAAFRRELVEEQRLLEETRVALGRAQSEAADRTAVLVLRIVDLCDETNRLAARCRDLADINRAHSGTGGGCIVYVAQLEAALKAHADHLALLQRANESMDPPVGIRLEDWTTALEDTRTRVIAEKALTLVGGDAA